MSTTAARSLPLEAANRRPRGVLEITTGLSRREATLRSAATTCLAGIALVQAIELQSLNFQGTQFAVLAGASMAVCIALGLALAAAPARVSRQLWGLVAATGFVNLTGWAAQRIASVPGLAHHHGHWTAMPGGLIGVLAATALVLAVVAAPPTRAAARSLATAVAVVLALAPGVGALIVALGPGLAGGETSLAAGVHVHNHGGLDETLIRFQPISGGHGGHYVYLAAAPPHQTVLGVTLIILAAIVFTYGAIGCLRRRTAPRTPVSLPGPEGRLA